MYVCLTHYMLSNNARSTYCFGLIITIKKSMIVGTAIVIRMCTTSCVLVKCILVVISDMYFMKLHTIYSLTHGLISDQHERLVNRKVYRCLWATIISENVYFKPNIKDSAVAICSMSLKPIG